MNHPANATRPRNLQLDFFRGVALLIIFVNHIPFNDLFFYTPSRFGFSDAADTFVFLSGFAAAIAYGRCFERLGLWLGSLRVLYRCSEIYVAHLGLFFILAAVCALGNAWLVEPDYIERLYIQFFFDRTQEALPGLVTLRYVPNYFDILPMYLVVMLWVPVVWGLSRVHIGLALAFPPLVYLAMWVFGLELPAEPLSDRPWYFNPFGWQLLFFTGYALGSGWLKPPPYRARTLYLALFFLLISIPLAHEPTYRQIEWLGQVRHHLEPWVDKSHMGPLRWLHFLALAHVMNRLFTVQARWLESGVARRIIKLGQQSLPAFLICMTLSYIAGMVLDRSGRDGVSLAVVNAGGWLVLLLAAEAVAWLKSKPWKASTLKDTPAGIPVATASTMLPWQWVRTAALPVLVTTLAVVPLLLTQSNATGGDAMATVSIDPSTLDTQPVLEGEGDEPIEFSDGV
jgi:hypothetical protein